MVTNKQKVKGNISWDYVFNSILYGIKTLKKAFSTKIFWIFFIAISFNNIVQNSTTNIITKIGVNIVMGIISAFLVFSLISYFLSKKFHKSFKDFLKFIVKTIIIEIFVLLKYALPWIIIAGIISLILFFYFKNLFWISFILFGAIGIWYIYIKFKLFFYQIIIVDKIVKKRNKGILGIIEESFKITENILGKIVVFSLFLAIILFIIQIPIILLSVYTFFVKSPILEYTYIVLSSLVNVMTLWITLASQTFLYKKVISKK